MKCLFFANLWAGTKSRSIKIKNTFLTFMCIYIYICVCMYVCMGVCMYVYIYIYTYMGSLQPFLELTKKIGGVRDIAGPIRL